MFANKKTRLVLLLFLAVLSLNADAGNASNNTPTDRPVVAGRILVATGKLIMIDRATKKVLWETTELRVATSVAALPNGEFLVGERKSLARVSSEGKLIARTEDRFKMIGDVKVLANGHILVSDGQGGTVQETDWEGKIYWSVSKLHWPSEAVRLASGNTLVADGTAGLKEFDSAGVLVKTTWLKRWAAAVERLPDATTLVGESRTFELLDPDGKPIWTIETSSRVTGVQRLSESEYLIAQPDAGSVAILDSGGQIIWEVTGLGHPWHALHIP
jgi:outer membrane protein assembly factor BamB